MASTLTFMAKCSKEIAMKLGAKPARRLFNSDGSLSQPAIYAKESSSVMIATGSGVFVWPLEPMVIAELKSGKQDAD